MALVIKTNLPALNAKKQIGNTQNLLSASYEKLASGKKLNKAADDAAALAISEELTAQLRSLEQAQRNTMDGVSMIQTADGAAGEMGDALVRMRELAVQAGNGTLSDTDRAAIEEEFGALMQELDRTAATTEFNGSTLLDGSTSVSFQIGTGTDPANDRVDVAIPQTDSTTLGNGTDTLSTQSLSTQGQAVASLDVIDGAMNRLGELRASLGATQNRLSSANRNLSVERENIAAANSRIADVDVASEVVEQARNQILLQSQTSVLVQANQLPAMALSLIG